MDKPDVVPGFIIKLWNMINDSRCDDLICWSDNGESFIILDPTKFTHELSKYFKHNNLSSFIRQLNMYGFRKVATFENCGLQSANEDLHFYHPNFVKNEKDRLKLIKRKLPQKITETIDIRNVVKDISQMEEKQNNVSKTLEDLKRENAMLWDNLHDLRFKHRQQQMYINNLMKLVYEAIGQNPAFKGSVLPIKKSYPLMIGNAEQVDPQQPPSEHEFSGQIDQTQQLVPIDCEQPQGDALSDASTAIDAASAIIPQNIFDRQYTDTNTPQLLEPCTNMNIDQNITPEGGAIMMEAMDVPVNELFNIQTIAEDINQQGEEIDNIIGPTFYEDIMKKTSDESWE